MNLPKLIIGIIIFLFASCNQKQEKTDTSKDENSIASFVKTFEGNINGKYPIIAKIKSNSGQIEGNYYYTKVGQELELKGTIDKDGKLMLEEFDANRNQTGQFEGKYVNGKIEGQWSKPIGDKNMPFELIESNTDYLSAKGELRELKNLNGRYESPSGTITINQKKGQEFNFAIIVANAKGCTGDLKGKIKVGTDKIGIYKSRTCKELSFEFLNKEIRVEEEKCDEHGMSCWFSGTYKKI